MKSVILYVALITMSAFAVAAQAPTPDVTGNWLATLPVNGTNLRLVLKIEKSANGYTATFDSPDQDATGLPIIRLFWMATS